MLDATPLLRAYAGRRLARLARQEPAAAQHRELMRLLRAARGTRFGIAHGFGEIGGVGEYQARVTLRRWEDFWREWWAGDFPRLADVTWPGTIPCFANTSGTSGGTTKRIPVSRAMLRSNRRAALEVLVFHVANRSGKPRARGAQFPTRRKHRRSSIWRRGSLRAIFRGSRRRTCRSGHGGGCFRRAISR